MEWHKAFVQWQQEGGLYISFSKPGRWKLLSIGQELAVVGHICCLPNKWMEGTLPSYDLADWFLQIQTRECKRAWPHANLRNQLLAVSLDAACAYQEETANPLYDVGNKEEPPKPLWSSHSSLQTVLIQQLEVWQQKTPNIEQRSHLESVVKAALQSYLESYPTMKETYAKVKQLAVPSILHQFLAPVKLVSAFGENDKELLAFLAARDTDGFNKWEAGQKLFTSRHTH